KAVFAPRLLAEREQTNRVVSALFAEEGALSRFAPETQDEIRFQASQPMTREQHRQFRSSLAALAQSQLEWGWNVEAAQEQLQRWAACSQRWHQCYLRAALMALALRRSRGSFKAHGSWPSLTPNAPLRWR